MAAETEHDLAPHRAAAAVLIQKTYRGYRARRKLADAAIMSKAMGWWNVVDAAVLQQQTLQYYAHSKSWKANDNWKRLKSKASKVGKGLEKNGKALKLALQHWLEAVDARHRYGHNLRPYYLHWQELETLEPFFYWLDLGSGRQVELPKCSRTSLQQQQITYLSPEQRKHYEVAIYNGKLYYQSSGELVHTPGKDRWIFVMSPSYKLYIGKKQQGRFQHSSFLAGGATTAAGRLVVNHGVLKLMEAHSGHYRPSPENFQALVGILVTRGADLHLAKVQLVSDDLLEKNKAQELAGQVRHAIEGHVDVKVEDQSLVSRDHSIGEGRTECLVTNLTFPELETAEENKEQAAEDLAEKSHEANAEVSKEQQVTSQPEQVQPIDPPGVPKSSNDVQLPEEVQKQEPAIVEEKPVHAEEAVMEEKSVQNEEAIVEQIDVMKKPSAVATILEQEIGLGPKTATSLPTSPGFSRNSQLANLGAQHRREALKKYGPRKTAFGTTPLGAIPQTC